jgi:hypothetical protein
MIINAVGALATTTALCIVMISKFSHGAWITALVVPGLVLFFRRLKHYNEGLASAVRAEGPLDVSNLAPRLSSFLCGGWIKWAKRHSALR